MSRTRELEALLESLGSRALEAVDDRSQDLIARHAARFADVAVFARRGWVAALIAKTDAEYSAREYERVLGRLLRPIGSGRVAFDDELGVVTVDQERFQTELPVHEDNQVLDLAWLLDVANLVASAGEHVVVTMTMPPEVLVAIVPRSVWTAIVNRRLDGPWSAMSPVVPLFN